MLGFFQFFRKLQEDDYRKTTSVQEYLMKGKKKKQNHNIYYRHETSLFGHDRLKT